MCIYILCTCIIVTSVFFSYDNTLNVNAMDEEAYYKTAVGVVLSLLGVIEIAVSGGSATPIGAAQIAAGLAMSGIELKNYLIDNGDGTFTVTPEFMQLVLDEQKRQEESYFHDFKSIQNYDGTYHVSGYSMRYETNNNVKHTVYTVYDDSVIYRPFAVDSGGFGYSLYQFESLGRQSSFRCKITQYYDGVFSSTGSLSVVGSSSSESYGVNVPVFGSMEAALAAFESGNFRSALNYREPLFQYGSIYAPVYTGGSVRISKSVLDGFEDELKEVNDKYDDVDDKINALYEYIFNGGNSGGGNSGGGGTGGGFDFDFDFPFDMDDLWELLEDPFEFGSQFIQEMFDFFKEIAGELTKKFPFCIPWDIYRLFNILSGSSGEAAAVSMQPYGIELDQGVIMSLQEYGVSPDDIQLYAGSSRDAPYFELPIVIERYGIDARIIVDMSPFQPISTLSRFLFTIVFCVGLIKFTVKFTEILKGVFD